MDRSVDLHMEGMNFSQFLAKTNFIKTENVKDSGKTVSVPMELDASSVTLKLTGQ